MKKTLIYIVAIFVLSDASATTITLDTSSLPSAQGWDYLPKGIHTQTPETDLFSTDGSVLSMNTTNEPLSSLSAIAVYRQLDVVEDSLPTVMEWTSRTLDYEGDGVYGFFMGFRTSTLDYSISMFPDKVAYRDGNDWQEILINGLEYHTYRMEATVGALTYDFYIDDVFQGSGAPKQASYVNHVLFGDGTGRANARSDISALEFTQIPEPGVIGLISLFGFGVIFVRRLFPPV
jgi:hypothetical protein